MKLRKIQYWIIFSLIMLITITQNVGNVSNMLTSSEAITMNSTEPGSTVVLTEHMNIKYFGEKKNEFAYARSGTYVEGNYWILDNSYERIGIFSAEGDYMSKINNSDFDETVLNQPVDILNNGTHVLILNNFFVSVLDFNGTLVHKFGQEGLFSMNPVAKDFEFNGTHYFILDSNANQIRMYNLDGTSGPVHNLPDIGLAGGFEVINKYYYVTDESNGRIVIYDLDFNRIRYITNGNLIDPKGIFINNGLIYVNNFTSVVVYDDNYDIKNTIDNYHGEQFTELVEIKMINGKIMTSNYPYIDIEGSSSKHPGMQFFNINVNQVTVMEGDESIRISWRMPTVDFNDQMQNYVIYRGDNPHDLHRIGIVSSDQVEYIDTVIRRGMTYHYAVSIVNQYGETSLSDIVSIYVSNRSIQLNDSSELITITESEDVVFPLISMVVPVIVILLVKKKNKILPQYER